MFDTLNDFFHRGGYPVMFGILACLLWALGLVSERIYRYWFQYDLSNTDGFNAAIQKLVMNNSIENAIRLCQKQRPKLVPFVLYEGLKRSNDSKEEIEYSMDYAATVVTPQVGKSVPMLGSIANVATLLGLLGTIFGLMKSFGAAAKATGSAKQALLAEGISEALTATSFGLSTALLCLFVHGVLVGKQQAIMANITQSSTKLADLLHTRKVKM
jgi:biopolymer transport protein ExbB